MIKIILILLFTLLTTACMVVPETVHEKNQYQCSLSTDKKVLKVVNMADGDTSFYEYSGEVMGIITMPTSAIISGTYVLVNNVYHYGEETIKCS